MLPLYDGGTYNFVVDWGDTTSNTITTWDQAETTHTYESEGTYTVIITGTINGWKFNDGGDKEKLLNIIQWGALNLGNGSSYFTGCTNLIITATDLLDLTGITNWSRAFSDCPSLVTVPRMNEWDMSNATTMSYMFYKSSLFNQNIGAWNVSNVTTMQHMFNAANAFNGAIGSWNVSKVTNMANMFTNAYVFNRNIGGWNTANVTAMQAMFGNARAFNRDIGHWNVGKVTTMVAMFSGATAFNRDIGSWNIVSVASSGMADMFKSVTLSTPNYNALLIGWGAQAVKSGVVFSAGNSRYTAGWAAEAARTHLVSGHSWTISDGGPV